MPCPTTQSVALVLIRKPLIQQNTLSRGHCLAEAIAQVVFIAHPAGARTLAIQQRTSASEKFVPPVTSEPIAMPIPAPFVK
jgi:hypothetical protein